MGDGRSIIRSMISYGQHDHHNGIGLKIIPEPQRKMKLNVSYRMDTKLHGKGKIEFCSHEGCELYGIVRENDLLLCFRHYRERHSGLQEPQGSQGSQVKSLLRRRPMAGTADY